MNAPWTRAGIAAGLLLLASPALGADADAIYFGGPIVTMNDRQPSAEAVAVKGGKIVAVGSRRSVEKGQKGPRTAMVDLRGRTMVPGFIDAHGHMWGAGVQAVAANLLPPPDGGVRSIRDLQEQLRAWMTSSPIARDLGVVIGFGYDDSQLAEQRHPTAEDLDAVSTELPMIVIHQSGHLHALNTRALEMAGITAATEDPQGGAIRRKPGTREPSGVMEGTVLIREFLRIMPRISPEQQLALLDAGQKLYARYGHTTAQEGRALPGNVDLYVAAARAGRLELDVVVYPEALLVEPSGGFMTGPYAGRTYRNGLRIGGVKLTLDASPQGRTAWLSQPYLTPPPGQAPGYVGYPALTDDQAIAAVSRAYENGWQILIHANGDAAIDQLIRAVRAASARHPGKDRRTVLIHGQTLREDQVAPIKALGIFPALFPMHTFYWGDWYVDTVLGPARAADISPTGWMVRNGMIFTSHHDAPVAFPDTMRVLSATVTRTTRSGQVLGPEHRVEPIVALKAMTLWAAHQHFEEKSKGSIEVGKLADFAILSENPLTADRQRLADIQVVETIKKGKTIFRREPAKAGTGPVPCDESRRCYEAFAAFQEQSAMGELFGEAPHGH
ncbi:MAG TPA: amidohydrolase [Anaeromyxobacteraceae bacterium]|nr:amidohydrolase [Anaeromyxobacteraceae bacterium]